MTASQAQEPGPGPAAPEPAPGPTATRKTFDSLNPATGQPIATFPVYQREDADVAVSRAREAARWWGGLGWRERRSRLLDWKSFLTRHMDEPGAGGTQGGGSRAGAPGRGAPGQLLSAGSAPRVGPMSPRDPSAPG